MMATLLLYGIKMFCYGLATLNHLPVKVLPVKPIKQSLHVPDNSLMKEFMKRHLPKAEYIFLKGEPEYTILTYLQQQTEKLLVVLGVYQRGRVSRWFKPNMTDMLMKNTNFLLFTAHK